MGAVLVHPALKTVLPIAAEPITRQDGANKNDCERNAALRYLRTLIEAVAPGLSPAQVPGGGG